MIITGRTINQLPTLSAITSASTLILQTGSTTFKASLTDLSKSPVFGSMYQDLIPVSSNTFSIGSSGSTIKSINVNKISIGQNGAGANTLNIFEGQNSGGTITSFIRADGTISGSTFIGDGSQLSRYYGSFYNTSTMTAANTTTGYIMSANTTGVNSGVILSSGSRIVMQSAGTYDIKYSAQLIKTSSSPSSSTVSIWLRKNGTDIQNTNAEFDITKLTANNGKTVASFNYIDTFTAGQYIEFVWSTTSTDVTVGNIDAQANPTRPTTPSLYVSVSQV